jgi:DNA polymerase-3 subunit gamma/tau
MQLASITFDGEKKKPDFIIPAENFKKTVVVPPTIKLSEDQKKLITDNEYAIGSSAASASVQIADPKNFRVRTGPTIGLPDPEKSNCHPTEINPEELSKVEEGTEDLASNFKSFENSPDLADLEPNKNSEEKVSDLEKDQYLNPSEEVIPKLFVTEIEDISEEEEKDPSAELLELSEAQEDIVVGDTSESISKEVGIIEASEEMEEEIEEIGAKESEEKPDITQEKVSGLSIKSIRLKKELLAKQQGNVEKAAEVKSEKFTETQLHAAWDEYIHRLKNKGEKILASIMETDMPGLKGTVISLELPADTMKKDLERGQNSLMLYLKKKLQNTLITLEIEVNETTAKKYAFTNIEKYNKLKEKNPLIEKLRTTFDLDL